MLKEYEKINSSKGGGVRDGKMEQNGVLFTECGNVGDMLIARFVRVLVICSAERRGIVRNGSGGDRRGR